MPLAARAGGVMAARAAPVIAGWMSPAGIRPFIVATCDRGPKALKWRLGKPDRDLACAVAGAGRETAGTICERSQALGRTVMFGGFFGSFGIFFIINLVIQFVKSIFGIA